MNKLFAKIAGLTAALVMVAGAGVALASHAEAKGVSASYEGTTSIAAGDTVVFGYIDGSTKKELSGVTTSGTTIGTVTDFTGTAPAGVYPLTVAGGSSEGSFAFQNSEGKYLSWSSGNSLTTSSDIDNASSWIIAVSSGSVRLQNVGTTARYLQYNAGSPRFACYGNQGQKAFTIFKDVEDTGDKITITYHANGGTGEMDPTVASAPTAASCGFTAPKDMKFGSWNTSADGKGTTYEVGASVSADIDLYAIWVDIPSYTCAQAIAAIDAGTGTKEVYVSGYVTSIYTTSDKFSGGKISYYIADTIDGGNQLEAYLGLGLNGEPFTALSDVEVGAFVKIFGDLTKFNSTYEFAQGNYLVSYEAPVSTEVLTSISVSDEKTEYVVGDEFVKPTVTAHYESGNSADVSAKAEFSGFDSSAAVASQTITVSYTENAVTKEAEYTVSISEPAPVEVKTYKKVKTGLVDFTGDYLIVYEGDGTEEHPAVAFNGSLDKLDAVGDGVSVTIENETIQLSEEYEFHVAKKEGGYSIESASGVFMGMTSNANGMNESATDTLTNSISYSESMDIVGSGNAVLRYNYANNQLRFRFYKTASYAAQQAIEFYMEVADDAEALALDILNLTYVSCSSYEDGVSAYTSETFAEAWEALTLKFNALGDEKSALVSGKADENGSMVEEALARYDFLTGKYGLANFITGRASGGRYVSLGTTEIENDGVIAIVTIVAITSISAIVVLLVIKKRKAQ